MPKDDIHNIAIQLINKGNVEEAKSLLNLQENFSQQDFLESLKGKRVSEPMIGFLKTFENVAWADLVADIKVSSDFVKGLITHNIDFQTKSKNGITLTGAIIHKAYRAHRVSPHDSKSYENFINLMAMIPENELKHEFEHPTSKSDISFLVSQRHIAFLLLASKKPEDEKFFKPLKQIISYLEESPAYRDSFLINNDFIDACISQNTDSYRNRTIFIVKNMFNTENANIIISSILLRDLHKSSPMSASSQTLLDSMIEDNTFNPDIKLLSKDYQKSIKDGSLNPDYFKYLRVFVEKGITDISHFNKIEDGYYTLYESLLEKGINAIGNDKDIMKVIDNLETLTSLGVLPLVKEKNKTAFKEKINQDIQSAKESRDFGELRSLGLEPYALKSLIAFFDKRYGHQPAQEDISEVTQKLITLIDNSISCAPESKVKKRL